MKWGGPSSLALCVRRFPCYEVQSYLCLRVASGARETDRDVVATACTKVCVIPAAVCVLGMTARVAQGAGLGEVEPTGSASLEGGTCVFYIKLLPGGMGTLEFIA